MGKVEEEEEVIEEEEEEEKGRVVPVLVMVDGKENCKSM